MDDRPVVVVVFPVVVITLQPPLQQLATTTSLKWCRKKNIYCCFVFFVHTEKNCMLYPFVKQDLYKALVILTASNIARIGTFALQSTCHVEKEKYHMTLG